jgi:hypothetical protein
MRRLFSAMLMAGTAVMAPMVVPTQALAASVSFNVRVYDPYRHDYHRWDRYEEHRYRGYLAERHRPYVGYERQREAERRAYWHWRHERWEREHWRR